MNDYNLLCAIIVFCRSHPIEYGDKEAESALWARLERVFADECARMPFEHFADMHRLTIRAAMRGEYLFNKEDHDLLRSAADYLDSCTAERGKVGATDEERFLHFVCQFCCRHPVPRDDETAEAEMRDWLTARLVHCWPDIEHFFETHCREIKRAMTEQVMPRVNHGQASDAANSRYAAAVDALKESIRVQPDNARAHYHLGLAYAGIGRYSDAVDAYEQAIRLKPDYVGARYHLWLAYAKLGL